MREEKKRKAKSFLPRSTEFRWSVFVGPKTKVHRIDEGYAWVPRKKYFIEDPRKEIEFFGFRKLPTHVFMLQEVRNFSYLGLLSIFGSEKEGFSFKGLFGEEKLDFRVLLDASSPRRTSVLLGEGVNILKEDWFFA